MTIEREDLGGGRGLGRYGSPVADTYHDQLKNTSIPGGSLVTVHDSSAAMYDACWLRIEGEAHLRGPVRPLAGLEHGIAAGDISAHLNVEKAKEIRNRLDAWIQRVGG
jgi:hypothetical protein